MVVAFEFATLELTECAARFLDSTLTAATTITSSFSLAIRQTWRNLTRNREDQPYFCDVQGLSPIPRSNAFI
jgi:hypothetical protein